MVDQNRTGIIVDFFPGDMRKKAVRIHGGHAVVLRNEAGVAMALAVTVNHNRDGSHFVFYTGADKEFQALLSQYKINPGGTVVQAAPIL